MKIIVLAGILVVLFIVGYVKFKPKPEVIQDTMNQPAWITELIQKEERNPVSNPPSSFTKCTYRNQTVYYIPSRSGDIPSVVYDEKGNKLCSPDGGFTGRGDGKCSDFFDIRTDCKVIWEDSRRK